MATGGIDPPITDGHEIFYEWRCNKCEDNDCIAEAIAYCRNCRECFCVTCLGVHKSFARDHTVLTEVDKGDWGKSNITPFVAQEHGLECSEHKGQYVSMYCGHHDDVCCPLCAIFKHGEACKPTMSYIPSVAQGVSSSAAFNDFIATNEQLILKIEQMEGERSDCLAVVSSSREECRMKIAAICQRLIDRIEELQHISITDADTKHDVEETTIRNDIDKCAELKLQLNDIKQQMQASNPINESALFINMKSGQKCHQKCKPICESLSKRQTKTFEFQEDPDTLRASLPDTFGECIEKKRGVNSIAATNKLEKDLLVTMNTGDDREDTPDDNEESSLKPVGGASLSSDEDFSIDQNASFFNIYKTGHVPTDQNREPSKVQNEGMDNTREPFSDEESSFESASDDESCGESALTEAQQPIQKMAQDVSEMIAATGKSPNRYYIEKLFDNYLLKISPTKSVKFPDEFETGDKIEIDGDYLKDQKGNIFQIQVTAGNVLIKPLNEAKVR